MIVPHRSQAGYSLTEMLVVVAMIGVLSLVAVPSFITMRNSNKVKTSVGNFVNDVRYIRALAISTGRQTKLGFSPGAGVRGYNLYQGDSVWGTSTWTALPHSRGARFLDDIVYFPTGGASSPQDFTNVDTTSDLDVIFTPDGGVKMPPGLSTARITIQTDLSVPHPQYQISISPSGRVSIQ